VKVSLHTAQASNNPLFGQQLFIMQVVPILVPSSELNNIIYTDIKINL
jgi:hypothetical protein